MRLRRILAAFPFAVVGVLAVALSVAALLSAPRVPDSAARESPSVTAPTGAPTASPTATPAATPTASPSESPSLASGPADLLRIHNELRQASGAPLLRMDERVVAAAQKHAEYLARHRIVGHDETPGNEGFTGATVRDRLSAQGYEAPMSSEVATSFSSAIEGVRSLWVLPYHRIGMLHPHAVVAGWGHADIGGRTATVGVIVYDFASAAPEVVRSPAAGQRVSATWDGEETPDALPSGAARPVGYPIMLMASSGRPVELRGAKITDPTGRDVAHHVIAQIYERDYVAIAPAAPLGPGTRYRVRLDLTVAGTEATEEWEFETER